MQRTGNSRAGPLGWQRLLQLVIDTIPQRVFWKDRDSLYLGCNRSFARDAGLDDPALIVGKTDFDLAWKATAHLYVADDRLVMESNTPKIDIEEPMTFPDGRTIWLRTSKVPLRSEGDSVFGVLGMYEDVTEQRQAAIERTRLAEIVEQANEDVIMTDVGGNITYVNPAFERISGYSRGEVQGRNPRFLKSGRRDAKFYADLWRTITGGGVWSGHFMNKGKDGTIFEEEGSIFPVRDPAGQIVSYVAIKRDVTQEVRLKEQLLQAQKMESVGRLAGGIAHDFNNLLTAILGYAELAAGRLKPEDPSRLELSEIDDGRPARRRPDAAAPRLQPQAGARASRHRPEPRRERHEQDAETAHRRGRRARHVAEGATRLREGRHGPDRAGAPQPGGQLPRRDAERREADDRDFGGRARRGLLRRSTSTSLPAATSCSPSAIPGPGWTRRR